MRIHRMHTMYRPTFIVGTATAIALACPSAVLADEMLIPPAALQQIQTPGRIILAPVSPPVVNRAAPESVLVPEPERFSDTAIAIEIAAPASKLTGTVAAEAQSIGVCPRQTELLGFTPDQLAQAATGSCPGRPN